jgi:uncharacterized membrane protein
LQESAAVTTATGLPSVRTVGLTDPFRWLAGGWLDLWRAPGPSLAYGLSLAIVSFVLASAIYATDAAFWVLALTFGFVFLAPMLAMGLYEAGRRLESGERPSLAQMLFVRSAFRQDAFYLGLALLLIYLFWGRLAQIVYGLSTWRMYETIPEFVTFALTTPEGHNMLVAGSIVGGVLAFFTFALTVVAAPMLLDPKTNVFVAAITSFRAVAANPAPMLLWAVIIALLVAVSAASAFAGFVLIVPWLGLASWRASRALVAEAPAGALAPALP